MELKVGDKVFFNYSKYYRYRPCVIKKINKDGTYKVAYQECGWQYRNIPKSKIYLEKPQRLLELEKEEERRNQARWIKTLKFYDELEKLCEKYGYNYDFDIDHPKCNKIHVEYYEMLNNAYEIDEFLDKHGKLGESVRFIEE